MKAPLTLVIAGYRLTAACLAVACAVPAMATSMKASDDNAGGRLILRCGTAAVQDAAKAIDESRDDKPRKLMQARLVVGSSTTWVVEGGEPMMVTYCVAPAVQNSGNTPWTQTVDLKLVDTRQVDYVNEDPNAKNIFTPKPKTGKLIPSQHEQAKFPLVPVPLPVIPGPWVGVPVVPANSWCKTVPWYKRPDLQIQATGPGAGIYCPVQFSSPLSRIKANPPQPKD